MAMGNTGSSKAEASGEKQQQSQQKRASGKEPQSIQVNKGSSDDVKQQPQEPPEASTAADKGEPRASAPATVVKPLKGADSKDPQPEQKATATGSGTGNNASHSNK